MKNTSFIRLRKEALALGPLWFAVAGLMIALCVGWGRTGFEWVPWAVYPVGVMLLAGVSMGHEFANGTMGALLASPISRRRLWWEKFLVLSVALVLLAGLTLALELWHVLGFRQLPEEPWLLMRATYVISVTIFTLGAVPLLTLLLRNGIGGAILAFAGALGLIFLLAFFIRMQRFEGFEESALAPMVGLSVAIIGGSAVLWSCRYFGRLEDAQQITFPIPCLETLGFSRELNLGKRPVLSQLIRKEIRLQRPALLLTALMLIGWAGLMFLAWIKPGELVNQHMVLPFVGGLGVAVLTGILSTAEERNLGVHDWHLTLPVSPRQQWYVKFLVSLVVNTVLGILLPWLMKAAADRYLADEREVMHYNHYLPFTVMNLFFFGAAIYASTISANILRAIAGIMFILIATAICTSGLGGLGHIETYIAPTGSTFLFMAQVGVLILITGLAFEMCLTNYRRTLGSLWQAAMQLTCLFAILFTSGRVLQALLDD